MPVPANAPWVAVAEIGLLPVAPAAEVTAKLVLLVCPGTTITTSSLGGPYNVRDTVPLVATVKQGVTPISGASVKFYLVKPGGSTATKTVTTVSDGTATWSYRVNQKDPKGTYSYWAETSYGGTLVRSPAPDKTFVVQ